MNQCVIQMDVSQWLVPFFKMDFYPSAGDPNTVGIQKAYTITGEMIT